MPKPILIKNHLQEIELISKRSLTMFIMICILILLLIVRLSYLQIVQHNLYTTLSKKNWLELVPLEPTRGLIYDRNGILLAENIPTFSLDVIPYQIPHIQQALSQLAKLIPLKDEEISQFQKQLKQHRRFEEIPLKYGLTEKEVALFSENQYRFPGMVIKALLLRHYPYGNILSHVLGYVGRINTEELNEIDSSNYSATNYIGKLGIEKYYEDELHGRVGYEQAENDASGQPIRILNQIKPIAGENIWLTIDVKLQVAIKKILAGHRGAVVAIQPSTGQILAMASEPSYDPNLFVTGLNNKEFQELQNSPQKPLYNRAIRGLYPLASTIKPFIALQGLNSGVIDESSSINDPGWFQLKNSEHVFHDWQHTGHGIVNISKAITKSCDTFFYDLAAKLGILRIDDILKQFGFGELTGIDISEELPGNVASPQWKKQVKKVHWYEGDTINSGIGQGFMQATPVQLANAVATLANRGHHFTPYLLYGEQEIGKSFALQSPTPVNEIKLKDAYYWEIVRDAMRNVVQSPEGTAYVRFGKNYNYTLAGKTGTAQVYSKKYGSNEDGHDDQNNLPERLRDHSLFIAFAPLEKPQIALAIIVENSNLAVGMARKILDVYLDENHEVH